MRRIAVIVMVLTVISKLTGFVRGLFLTYFYGVSAISDAYIVSLSIPYVIFGFIGGGLTAAYIPALTNIEHQHGRTTANKFTSNLINLMLIILLFVFVVSQLQIEKLIHIVAMGFDQKTTEIAIIFTRFNLIGIFTTFLVTIFSGYFQVNGVYTIPALIGLPLNLVIVISIALSSEGDLKILGVGTAIAFISQIFYMVPFLIRTGYRHKLIFDLSDKNIHHILATALPVIIGTSVNRINVLIDRTIASSVIVGGVSALNYADELHSAVQALFAYSIAIAMYPMIAKMVALDDVDGLKESIRTAISSILFIITPITIGTLMFSYDIVSLIYARGAFDSNAISLTSEALFYYAIGMLAVGTRDILIRVYYSLRDTITPVINASIGVLINIILNIILSKYMGIGGLALATSIAAIVTATLMLFFLRKKIGPFGLSRSLGSVSKILISTFLMSIIAKFTHCMLSSFIGEKLSLVIAIGAGAISYFFAVFMLKVEETEELVNIFMRKKREKH